MNRNHKSLVLNIIPVTFNRQTVTVGKVPFTNNDKYEELRNKHRQTHVFRLDSRNNTIVNISIEPSHKPLGTITDEDVHRHLSLLGKVLQNSILNWVNKQRTILRRSRPVTFWGDKEDAKLLSCAIKECQLRPREGLEVVARYSFDTRILSYPDNPEKKYLALIIEVSTSNIIDVPLANILKTGLDITGKYVCRRTELGEDRFRIKAETLGAIAEIKDDQIFLIDNVAEDKISISDACLEPRQENLEAVIGAFYPKQSKYIIDKLKKLRAKFSTANDKLFLIRQSLNALKKHHTIETGDGLILELEDLLCTDSPLFPQQIELGRPSLLFGPQGRNSELIPDLGIQKWGPFKYLQNEKNNPVIAVLCEARYRGCVEQFVQELVYGCPDETWEVATSNYKEPKDNPYRGGLTSKFYLRDITLEYEEVSIPDASSYRRAANRLLARLPKPPDLAVVQTQQDFKRLHGENNPYFVSKAVFMQAGVPVQAVREETIEAQYIQIPRILNNIALASYAKLGGVPWVISTRRPSSHELVIGMGYSETRTSRMGERSRYVGITTLFQGDGKYQVWGLTREVEFDDYAQALLENLQITVRHVRETNHWRPGDVVRLIFHVYKPLKHKEMWSIKELVSGLIADEYQVNYAFLDISQYHAYHLFDPEQKGYEYGPRRQRLFRGVGVPERGIALQLDSRTAILHLVGPRDLKMDSHGLPSPLLVELHRESDFDDLTYLVRQIYHFTYMSWQSFFPAKEPVTISYSRMIAQALGNLKPLSGWNSSVLTVGSLRGSMWFL